MAQVITCLAWYRREDYPRIYAMMADRKKLPETFEDWEATALDTEEMLRSAGHVTRHVIVDPGRFQAWCLAKGRKLNAASRAEFAADAGRQH